MITPNITSRSLEYWLVHHLTGSYYPAIIPNYYFGDWECDVFSLNKSGYTSEYEIKQTKSDYLKDFEKTSYYGTKSKHQQIRTGKRTNRFWFILPEDLDVDIPKYAGRMNYRLAKYYANWIEFVIVKPAPLLHKKKATEEQKDQMLIRLSAKFYHQMMERTSFNKYQLTL